MNVLAFDIGGANLKAANGAGYAVSRTFPLWKETSRLAEVLVEMIAAAPTCERIVVTMTGELADCFELKSDGVRFILASLESAASARPIAVYLTDGRFVSPEYAMEHPRRAAASNWHALARFAGRFAEHGPAFMLDTGSTTTDLIPLQDGLPCARGSTDTERLLHGELVYTGVLRTPVCALLDEAPYRGHRCAVAAEWFATTHDASLMLDLLPEDETDLSTADSRPAVKKFAHARLARVVAADLTEFNESDAIALAEAVLAAQMIRITAAATKIILHTSAVPETIVVSGLGEFLARRAVAAFAPQAKIISLHETLGETISQCAPAHALAVLANEEL